MPSDLLAPSLAALAVDIPDDGDEMEWEEGDVHRAIAPQSDGALFDRHLAHAARAVWSVAALRPLQKRALRFVFDPRITDHVVVAEKTGGGKTLAMKMVGILERALIAVITPLHALTADVLKKFDGASQRFGTVQEVNLDELFDNARAKYNEVLDCIKFMKADTKSTLFVFMSPHFLVHHPDALSIMLDASAAGVLRTVMINEVHVLVQQGTSFRGEIRDLRDRFLRPHFHRPPAGFRKRLVMTSATFPDDYIDLASNLMTVPLSSRNVLRGSYSDFTQHSVSMQQRICSKEDYVCIGLK